MIVYTRDFGIPFLSHTHKKKELDWRQMLSHWKKCTKQKYVRPDAFRNNEPFGAKEIKPDVSKKPETRIDVCFDRGTEGLCDDLISERRATRDTSKLVRGFRARSARISIN